MSKLGINGTAVAGIGITNQRETTIVWDRKTGKPVYNAIVWQDRRTSKYSDELREKGFADMITNKTGLILDAYFSGTKVKWILDNVEGVRERAEKGELAFGTVDSWLVWNLTQGRTHITDATNASRTLLYNIHTLEWDDELLELMNIPKSILPNVKSSSEIYDYSNTTFFASKVPIAGIAGDQQSAMFGQMCIEEGIAFQTLDVLEAMKKDTQMDYTEIRVDGGAANNNLLMQFQSDILNKPVVRPTIIETTALGGSLSGRTGYRFLERH